MGAQSLVRSFLRILGVLVDATIFSARVEGVLQMFRTSFGPVQFLLRLPRLEALLAVPLGLVSKCKHIHELRS